MSESGEITDLLTAIEENDDIVYDIGANTGLYSLFAATKCPQGKVIAFEPYPPNVKALRHNITRNSLCNIEIVESALSDTVGEIKFNQPKKDDIGYGSSSIDIKTGNNDFLVPTTTGDTLVKNNEIPPPSVVKIDVEGAEPLVIDGMEDILAAPSCRALFCEVHLSGATIRPSIEDFGSSLKEIEVKLQKLGTSRTV